MISLREMIRPRRCIAIVKKDRPRIDPLEIYDPRDAKGMRLGRDERMIEVEIREA